jgi:hypothetical protein
MHPTLALPRYSGLSILLHWPMLVLIALTYAFIELRVLFERDTLHDPRGRLTSTAGPPGLRPATATPGRRLYRSIGAAGPVNRTLSKTGCPRHMYPLLLYSRGNSTWHCQRRSV